MRAVNLLRQQITYRRDAFDAGLRAVGYDVVPNIARPAIGDLLLIWNRYAGFDEQAKTFEQHGGLVVVVENGIFGKAWRGGEWFSIAKSRPAMVGGEYPVGDASRWESWDVQLAPWTIAGVPLILGQRGIGSAEWASPVCWAEQAQRRYGGRIRQHPGTDAAGRASLEKDLRSASECITWASGAAMVALLHGVPVWYELPTWIGAACSAPLDGWGKMPALRDDALRLETMRRVAWAQWTLDEVRTGEPFARLCAS